MADDELRHWSQVTPLEHGAVLEFPIEIFEGRGSDRDRDEEVGGCEDEGEDFLGVAACLMWEWVGGSRR